ncbi:MAG: ribonuclease HI family protein [Thermoplasmata archaeon]|nr:MAG: ribonuclease HI family protein [Thermoplasmata archaeon]
MGIGAVVWNDDREKIIELSEKGGFGTNNQAEYKAIVRGLQELSKIYSGDVQVQGDSQLVIKQMLGVWKVKKRELVPLYNQVKDLEQKFESVEYKWIERGENQDADMLSAKALNLEEAKRKDRKIQLKAGSSYEFIFDNDNKITTVKDETYNRDLQRYFVISPMQDGKKVHGNYFETGSKKLIEKLDYYKPLQGKRFRIYPTKAKNWIEYMVEELENE